MKMMESKRPVNEGVNYFQLEVTKLSAGVYILIVELNGYGYKAKFQKL